MYELRDRREKPRSLFRGFELLTTVKVPSSSIRSHGPHGAGYENDRMVSSRLELHTVLFSSLSSTLPGFQALTCFRLSKTLNRNRNSTPLSAASSAANSPQHLSSSSPPASPSSSEGWPPPETHKRKRQRLDYSSSDSEIAHVMQITSKESTPGSSQQQNNGKSRQENGNGSLSEKADMLGRVKKSELVRLILQSLHDLGYQ